MNKIRAIIRAEAIKNIPLGYRLVGDNERVKEHDLYYVYDEYYAEDKGYAKTWQQCGGSPMSFVGAHFHCCIRLNNSRHAWRRFTYWIALQLERFEAWKFRRFINE